MGFYQDVFREGLDEEGIAQLDPSFLSEILDGNDQNGAKLYLQPEIDELAKAIADENTPSPIPYRTEIAKERLALMYTFYLWFDEDNQELLDYWHQRFEVKEQKVDATGHTWQNRQKSELLSHLRAQISDQSVLLQRLSPQQTMQTLGILRTILLSTTEGECDTMEAIAQIFKLAGYAEYFDFLISVYANSENDPYQFVKDTLGDEEELEKGSEYL